MPRNRHSENKKSRLPYRQAGLFYEERDDQFFLTKTTDLMTTFSTGVVIS